MTATDTFNLALCAAFALGGYFLKRGKSVKRK